MDGCYGGANVPVPSFLRRELKNITTTTKSTEKWLKLMLKKKKGEAKNRSLRNVCKFVLSVGLCFAATTANTVWKQINALAN